MQTQEATPKSFLEIMRDEFKTIIDDYEKNETKLSDSDKKSIDNLKKLLIKVNSALELRQLLIDNAKKIDHKWFFFFPFVNDLRSNIENAIKNEKYNPINILIFENAETNQENKQLKKEINSLQQLLKGDSQPISKNEWENMTKKISTLEERLNAQINENSTLNDKIVDLENENKLLNEEKSKLHRNCMLKTHEIKTLRKEIDNLLVKLQKAEEENCLLREDKEKDKQENKISQSFYERFF